MGATLWAHTRVLKQDACLVGLPEILKEAHKSRGQNFLEEDYVQKHRISSMGLV